MAHRGMDGDHVDGRIIYVVCRIHPAKRGLCKGAGAGGIDLFNFGQFYLFQGTDQQKRIHRNGADFSLCFGFDPYPLIRGRIAVKLNEQVFFVIVFIKRHGGGGLGRIAMAFHLGQNDFGDKGQIKFAHLIQWYPA